MRLYILETLPCAKALAKALGYGFIPEGKNAARSSEGSPALFFWRGRTRLLAGGKKPALSDKMEALLAGLLGKDPPDEIICALFPSKTALLFADCIRRRFEDVNVYTAYFPVLKKEEIVSGLEHAEKLSSENLSVIRATGERHTAYAVSAALQKILPGESMRFDLHMLAALFLIGERENLRGSRRFRLETSIEAGEDSLPLLSERSFTEADAAAAAEKAGKKLALLSAATPHLPSAISLCGIYNGFAPSDLRLKDTAASLFEKGYISNPFTLSGALPQNASDRLKSQIISSCRAQFPKEDRLDMDALSRFAAARAFSPHAILPLKDSTASLTEQEAAVYQRLISCVKKTVCEEEGSLSFLDKKSGLRFCSPFCEDLPRGRESFTPGGYRVCEDGVFLSCSPEELLRELYGYGLTAPDVILTLIERLLKTGAVYADALGLHLSTKGQDLIRSFPSSAQSVLLLYQTALSAPAEPSDINAHLVRVSNDVNRTLAGWLSAFEKGEDPAEKDAPKEPPRGKDPASEDDAAAGAPALFCPFCKEPSLLERERFFVCESCGASIEKILRAGGALFTIGEKDIRALSESGRTKLKRGKNEKGDLIAGGYLATSEGSFILTHKSKITCPFCGENLNAYVWGFSCPACGLGVPFEVYQVRLKTADLKKLLAGKKTDPVSNLISPQGEVFCARLSACPGGKIRLHKLREEE